MTRVLKSRMFTFVLGLICAGSIGVVAYQMNATQITYEPKDKSWKVNTVKGAIDALRNSESSGGKKICILVSEEYGTKGNVGAKYACNLGDGEARYFYILSKNNDANTIDLIMDRNLDYSKMNYSNALTYFTTGVGSSIVNSWTEVEKVDLPERDAIVAATDANNVNSWFCFGLKDQSSCTNNGSWDKATDAGKSAVVPYRWLFDYTSGCTNFGCSVTDNNYAMGYWTKSTISGNYVWHVFRTGALQSQIVTNSTDDGVRPVITLKKNLL